MKKFLFMLAFAVQSIANAQTFTVENLVVNGTFTGATNAIALTSLAKQAANTVLANDTGSTANITAFAMPSCSTSADALQWTSATGFTCNTNVASSASPLSQFAATTSAQLAGVINDETGSGSLVFGTSPTIGTPVINTPAINNGTANGLVLGNTTPAAATVTTLTANSTVSGSGITTLLSPYTLTTTAAATYLTKANNLSDTGNPALALSNIGGVAASTQGRPYFKVTCTTTSGTFSSNIPTKTASVWDTIVTDPTGAWDNTNKRWVPQKAGWYQVTASIDIANGTAITVTGSYGQQINIYKNGSPYDGGYQAIYAAVGALTGTNASVPTVNALVQLNGTTDYIEIWVSSSFSSPETIAGVTFTYFQAYYVGP